MSINEGGENTGFAVLSTSEPLEGRVGRPPHQINDWNDLSANWRTDDGAVDIEALAAAATRGRRRQQARFAIEVIASVAVAAFWAPQLVHGGSGVRLLGIGSIVFVIVWCALLWRTLRGTWSSSSSSTSAYLSLQRQRLRAAHRWTRVVRATVVAMCVLLAVALPLLLRDGAADDGVWRVVGGVGGFVGICVAMWVMSGRHRRLLETQLAALESEHSPGAEA